MSIKAIIYARVSTDKQTIKPQLVACRRYARDRGWSVVDEYVDEGVSGSKVRRPEFDAMMLQAKLRRFRVCLVFRFDRFSRNLKQLVDSLEFFRSHGIQFVSMTEGIDTTTPMGEAYYGMVAAMANLERVMVGEATKERLAALKRSGVRLGRPEIRFDIAKARDLRRRGLGWRTIAREIGGVSYGTVRRVIQKGSPGPERRKSRI